MRSKYHKLSWRWAVMGIWLNINRTACFSLLDNIKTHKIIIKIGITKDFYIIYKLYMSYGFIMILLFYYNW